ncbi:unnamed protein product, partial [Rotaria sp. Silwood1]
MVILQFQEPPQAQPDLLPIFSGFIYASNNVDDNIAQIPYFGVVGDYKNTPIWVRNTPSGVITGLLNAAGNYISSGEYVNMTSSNKLSVVLVTAWSSRIVFVEVISGQGNHLPDNIP